MLISIFFFVFAWVKCVFLSYFWLLHAILIGKKRERKKYMKVLLYGKTILFFETNLELYFLLYRSTYASEWVFVYLQKACKFFRSKDDWNFCGKCIFRINYIVDYFKVSQELHLEIIGYVQVHQFYALACCQWWASLFSLFWPGLIYEWHPDDKIVLIAMLKFYTFLGWLFSSSGS